MRKFIYLIIILGISAVIGNFTVWFVHTQTIKSTLADSKNYLESHGYELKYKDIKFSNFLAWNVKAVIEEVSLKNVQGYYKNSELKFEWINLDSNPIKNILVFVFPKKYNFNYKNLSTELFNYEVIPASEPKIKLELRISLSKLDKFFAQGENNLSIYINELLIYNDMSEVYDISNGNQLKLSSGPLGIWVVSEFRKKSQTWGIRASKISTDIALELKGFVDKENKDAKKVELLNEFDRVKIKIEKINIENDLFSIATNGNSLIYQKEALPYFNLNVDIKNYKQFLNYNAEVINRTIEELATQFPHIPVNKITDDQVNKFAEFIKKFSSKNVTDDEIKYQLVRDKKGTTISGNDFYDLAREFQAIFFSKLAQDLVPNPNNIYLIEAIAFVFGVLVLLFFLQFRSLKKSITVLNEDIKANQSSHQEATKLLKEESHFQLNQLITSLNAQLQNMSLMQKNQFDNFNNQIHNLVKLNEIKSENIRKTLEESLHRLQMNNDLKLEKMRATVEEKLQETLEKRLSNSFKLVSERLEIVHKGLGEMQSLASGVGDLKKVLTNIKVRGAWGEVQLENLMSQILTPEQFEKNVLINPENNFRVEFAVKLPGRDDKSIWLPIDSKFPIEDFQRLIEAQEQANLEQIELIRKSLENSIKLSAKTISEKYIHSPFTTDFAIISSEVWKLLSVVKTEFLKFADILSKTKLKLDQASKVIGDAEVRSRSIQKKLHGVESLTDIEYENDKLEA
ncbi:hypothetical protein RFI_19848 [Reticulomyxa filosa]|uniref:Uncharacterized protein n=1 Tax=Reticulomyxa filosa TaxID=46433 RepID=X6MUI8_RETFI|nr:hypothetical protein RFI_19848 [Reticulomyxa filosa]|eukprot:ETO17474.1 hypothetical protein RFI_19848 [Reticulomyxa filosa]